MNNSQNPRVSIIMPVYNSAPYLSDAIASVLSQNLDDWELLIINDGSTDESESVIRRFTDSRIQYFHQKNMGVSSARNLGLVHAKGQFVCFLDSDDLLSKNSLSARLEKFHENEKIDFVDGKVGIFNDDPENIKKFWHPQFQGQPIKDLMSLSGKSFFGPTWMFRRSTIENIRFRAGMTHAEDLLFFIQAAMKGGLYTYTDEIIYLYRSGNQSAMSNLHGLKNGYKMLLNDLDQIEDIDPKLKSGMRSKVKSIMFKSFLSKLDLSSAIKTLFEF